MYIVILTQGNAAMHYNLQNITIVVQHGQHFHTFIRKVVPFVSKNVSIVCKTSFNFCTTCWDLKHTLSNFSKERHSNFHAFPEFSQFKGVWKLISLDVSIDCPL